MSENLKKVEGNSSLPMSLEEQAWQMVTKYRESMQGITNTRDSYDNFLSELLEREPKNVKEYLAKFVLQERDNIKNFIKQKKEDEINHFSLYELIFKTYANQRIHDEEAYPELKVSANSAETIALLKETFCEIVDGEMSNANIDYFVKENYFSYLNYRFSNARLSLINQPLSIFFEEVTTLSNELKINSADVKTVQRSIVEIKKNQAINFILYLAILNTNENKHSLRNHTSNTHLHLDSFLDTLIFNLLKKDTSDKHPEETFTLPRLAFSKYPKLLEATKLIFNERIHQYTALTTSFPSDVYMVKSKEKRIEYTIMGTDRVPKKISLHQKISALYHEIVKNLTPIEHQVNITTEQKETIEKLLSSLNSIVTLWNIGHTYAEKSEFEDQQDYGRFLMASAKLVMDGLRRNMINLEIALQNKDISYEFASLDRDLAAIEDKLRADQNVALTFLDDLRTSLEINNKISSDGNS